MKPLKQIGDAEPVLCRYKEHGWCMEELEETGEGLSSPVIG